MADAEKHQNTPLLPKRLSELDVDEFWGMVKNVVAQVLSGELGEALVVVI